MMFSDQRAREELGYDPRPASQAIADSARWFVENGYVCRQKTRPHKPFRLSWTAGQRYQPTVPWRSTKVPVGPSGPMVAMATMASVPSVMFCVPR